MEPYGVTMITSEKPISWAGVVTTACENGYTYVTEEEPPAYIFCDWHNNGKGWSEAKSNSKKKKAIVCHLQSKRKNTYKSLCLPLEAIPAHLAHGDEAGYCKEDN